MGWAVAQGPPQRGASTYFMNKKLMSIEYDILREIDFDKLIQDFARVKYRTVSGPVARRGRGAGGGGMAPGRKPWRGRRASL